MVETWTPDVVQQPPAIPAARVNLDIAAQHQIQGELTVRALRAADAVAAATDHLTAEFTRLIDAIKPWRRPLFISIPVGETRDNIDLMLPIGGPCVVESISVLPGAPGFPTTTVNTGTVAAHIRGLFGVDVTVFGWSTTGEVLPNAIYNIPVETDRKLTVQLVAVGAATGTWHVVINLAREQLRV